MLVTMHLLELHGGPHDGRVVAVSGPRILPTLVVHVEGAAYMRLPFRLRPAEGKGWPYAAIERRFA